MLTTIRSLWKDWGFPQQMFQQAREFIKLADVAANDDEKRARIRASIIFSMLAFEAHFNSNVRGYISYEQSGTGS